MKKIILITLILALLLTGCSRTSENNTTETDTASNEEIINNDIDKNSPQSTVYMTSDITSDSLVKVYDALSWTPNGNVAVKISSGEPPNSNYLQPDLIKGLVDKVSGTLVEDNTAYGGSRSETEMHYQVAEDHGYTAIAPFKILDEDGSISIPTPGTIIKEDFVGSAFPDYNSYIVLSHFKGHSMAGFGGAIKNASIGLASSEGKCWIHSGGTSKDEAFGGNQDDFLKSMGDAAKGISDYLSNGQNIVYINVMNRLSVDCDCDGNPAEPDLHDIGILASTDPVALDQACVDLVYQNIDNGGDSLVQRIEDKNGLLTLENAQDIGLGSRNYKIENI